LHSLSDFLAAAPKTVVIKLHRRESDARGLQQANKVAQLVYAWAQKPERLQAVLEELGAEGRQFLLWVYASGRRGLKESEIFNATEIPLNQAQYLLAKMEYELLCMVCEGESNSYHGFEELSSALLAALLPEFLPNEPTGSDVNWIGYSDFLTAHLNHFLAQAALNNLRVTQNGEMHRKNLQELAQRFDFSSPVSTVAAEEEVLWLLRYCAEEGLLHQDDGRLILTRAARELLLEDSHRVTHKLRRYWFDKRSRGLEEVLVSWAKLPWDSPLPPEGYAIRIGHAVQAFWAPTGSIRHRPKDKKTLFTWEHLPKSLQEMWYLGLLQFGISKGRLGWIRIDPNYRESILAPDKAPDLSSMAAPVAMPNFEVLAPAGLSFHRQHHLELTARRQNDEMLTRYRFSKESVVGGLQAGLEMSRFQDLITWLGFNPMSIRTLVEWGSSFASSRFREVTVLEVKDPLRLHELGEIPQMQGLVQETIPGFGFILERRHKEAVRELLQHFGLIPGEEFRPADQSEPLTLAEAESPAFPRYEPGEVAYREAAPILRPALPQVEANATTPEEREKLDQGRRIVSLEQAIAREFRVEFQHARVPGKRVIVTPRAVLKSRQPMKLIGVEEESGHRQEWLLEDMLNLRIIGADGAPA